MAFISTLCFINNKSIITKAYKRKAHWPYNNIILCQSICIFTLLRKKTYAIETVSTLWFANKHFVFLRSHAKKLQPCKKIWQGTIAAGLYAPAQYPRKKAPITILVHSQRQYGLFF
jgi:hypothetical protein